MTAPRRGVGLRERSNPGCAAVRHGSAGAYNAGCRCPEARDAWRLYRKRRTAGVPQDSDLLDATGTHRRVEALWALGWPAKVIGPLMGVSGAAVADLRRHRRLTRRTVDALAAVYDQLSMQLGPSARLRSIAVRRGWAPPLAWDDEVIDDPRASPARPCGPRRAGRPPTAATAERMRLTALWLAAGWTSRRIAAELGVSERTVTDIRARLRAQRNGEAA